MQQPRAKLITKALQPSCLLAIQTTSYEIILLHAAVHRYWYALLRCEPQTYQNAAPLIRQFIQRLYDQPSPSLATIQATPNEMIILQVALHHYQVFVHENRDLSEVTPLIQNVLQRLHEQLLPRKEERETR